MTKQFNPIILSFSIATITLTGCGGGSVDDSIPQKPELSSKEITELLSTPKPTTTKEIKISPPDCSNPLRCI